MKFGEFRGHVHTININTVGDKPAIFTRLVVAAVSAMAATLNTKATPAQAEFIVTHTIRLSNPDSTRIGFDELRGAFPKILGLLNDEQLLTYLIEHTDEFDGLPVSFGIEEQMKAGVAQKNAKGETYFNVRLRSGVRNLEPTAAKNVAQSLLGRLQMQRETNDEFKNANAPATAPAPTRRRNRRTTTAAPSGSVTPFPAPVETSTPTDSTPPIDTGTTTEGEAEHAPTESANV